MLFAASSHPPEKGEKGRKRAKKADFGRFPGRAARHPLSLHLLHPHLRQPKNRSQSPKAGHDKADRSDSRNRRLEVWRPKMRKMRKVPLIPEEEGSEDVPQSENAENAENVDTKTQKITKLWGQGSGGVSQSVRETSRDESQNVPSTQKLFKTSELELPIFQGSLPSCSPHSAGCTRTSVHPYFPVAKKCG